MLPVYLMSVSGLQPTMKDDELDECIARIALGNRDALSQLYYEVKSAVFGFALSILKNAQDAEDVLHDCFISIHNSASSYHSAGKPMAWIMTITRNLCYMKLRADARHRERHVDIPDEDWDSHTELSTTLSNEDRMIIAECLGGLGEEERQIVVLHAVSGMKHREIAAMLELPLPTVLSKYHRALKKMKEYFERGDEQNEASGFRKKNQANF